MASESQKRELVRKISKHVNERFGGSYRRAFDHYAGPGDNTVDSDELGKLLKAAGVGSALTRGMWVDGVMKEVDSNKDGRITWDEFNRVMGR